MERTRIDALIISIAERQHAVAARWQMLEAGISRHLIDGRLKRGWLRRMFAGVYLVGAFPGPRAREMAALLTCDSAAISHVCAAAIWTHLPQPPRSHGIDLTGPPGSRCGGFRSGINLHRSELLPGDVRKFDGLTITSPARTLVDLSSVISSRDLERAFARAERAEPGVRGQLERMLDEPRMRTRAGALRRLLGSGRCAFTRSPSERGLVELLREYGLPEPIMNGMVNGYEIDCHWPQARLAIEVDSFETHRSQVSFVNDHERDSALTAAGYRIMRISDVQVADTPKRLVVQIAQALAR